jgi:hypothetical protein
LDGSIPVQSPFRSQWSAVSISAINLFAVFGITPFSVLFPVPSSGPPVPLKPDVAITGRVGL